MNIEEHLLPWIALLYWLDAPLPIRFDRYDIELAILLADGTI